jgi:hypothetical protein
LLLDVLHTWGQGNEQSIGEDVLRVLQTPELAAPRSARVHQRRRRLLLRLLLLLLILLLLLLLLQALLRLLRLLLLLLLLVLMPSLLMPQSNLILVLLLLRRVKLMDSHVNTHCFTGITSLVDCTDAFNDCSVPSVMTAFLYFTVAHLCYSYTTHYALTCLADMHYSFIIVLCS